MEQWKDLVYRYRFVMAFVLLGLIGSVVVFSLLAQPASKPIAEENQLIPVSKETEEVKPEMIQVDIKGAVEKPGVYQLARDSRVQDAIEKSGGLRDDADTTILNLSKILNDESVVIIYTKEEIDRMRKGDTTVKYIEKECICPKLENDACLDRPITNQENSSAGKISLNKASLKELETLPGIGEAKAKAIIAYREKTPFQSIEDLKKVKGIGEAVFDKLKDQIVP